MKGVIAEDEQLLRDDLVARLGAAWPALELVAVCEDGGEALEAIANHQPDVAFLDIRMPGLTGLEVAAAAQEASPGTRIVFVTAYNQYAIEAFDRGAVDYLLKPIDPARLARTVKRLAERKDATGGDALAAVIAELRANLPSQPRAQPLVWLTASVGKETRLILIDDVAYFKADDKYTVVATAEGEALIRKPIRELLEALDPTLFKQVHRSTIVNLKAVAGITRDDSGRGTMRLKNRAETLPVSLTYMPLFKNM